MKKNTLLALISMISAITLFATQVKAEEKEYVERFSIELGTGVNTFLPFLHAKAGYLLPTENNNIQIKAEYSFFNIVIGDVRPQMASLELSYYFGEKNKSNNLIKKLEFSPPFINFGLLSCFTPEQKNSFGKNVQSTYNFTSLLTGIGTDLMVNKNFGFSTQINILPVLWDSKNNIIKWDFNIRPEVNLKFLF